MFTTNLRAKMGEEKKGFLFLDELSEQTHSFSPKPAFSLLAVCHSQFGTQSSSKNFKVNLGMELGSYSAFIAAAAGSPGSCLGWLQSQSGMSEPANTL